MQTWDKTKPQNDHSWECGACGFHTLSSWGTYDTPIFECPQCGSNISRLKVYLCPTCGTTCFGVYDYNWHTLHHWTGYDPLPDDVAAAMQKLEPGLWQAHLSIMERYKK